MQITLHLTELRKAQGLTQKQLADKSGVNIKSVCSAERARVSPEPTIFVCLPRRLAAP